MAETVWVGDVGLAEINLSAYTGSMYITFTVLFKWQSYCYGQNMLHITVSFKHFRLISKNCLSRLRDLTIIAIERTHT